MATLPAPGTRKANKRNSFQFSQFYSLLSLTFVKSRLSSRNSVNLPYQFILVAAKDMLQGSQTCLYLNVMHDDFLTRVLLCLQVRLTYLSTTLLFLPDVNTMSGRTRISGLDMPFLAQHICPSVFSKTKSAPMTLPCHQSRTSSKEEKTLQTYDMHCLNVACNTVHDTVLHYLDIFLLRLSSNLLEQTERQPDHQYCHSPAGPCGPSLHPFVDNAASSLRCSDAVLSSVPSGATWFIME